MATDNIKNITPYNVEDTTANLLVHNKMTSGVPDYTECYHSLYGREYVGKQNITMMGIPCQYWNATSPHM